MYLMRYFKFFILLFVLVSAALYSTAQISTFSGWLNFIGNVKLNKRLNLHFDAQLKRNWHATQLQGFLLRPGIIFRIKNNLSVAAGYALTENHRSIDFISGFTPEHIIWEQVTITHPIRFIIMSNRLRVEQRFISKPVVYNNIFKNVNSQFANRLRYQLKGIIPLRGQVKFKKGLYAVLQNEVFMNISHQSSLNGKVFDQNRTLTGGGYRFSNTCDVELDYMNQYISGKTKRTNNHILQCAVYIRL